MSLVWLIEKTPKIRRACVAFVIIPKRKKEEDCIMFKGAVLHQGSTIQRHTIRMAI